MMWPERSTALTLVPVAASTVRSVSLKSVSGKVDGVPSRCDSPISVGGDVIWLLLPSSDL